MSESDQRLDRGARGLHSLFDLSGRVAVITGGSRGIGKGIALGLAQAGADVSLWARDQTQADATAAEIRRLGVRKSFASRRPGLVLASAAR